MKDKILVIASHPDDEVLGCGATMALLAKKGHEVNVLILGEGKTSRKSDTKNHQKDLLELSEETKKSCKILGVKWFENANFPDNKFDSVPLLEIVQKIEEVKNKILPDIIFTHHFADINIDHQIAYKAVLTATRPMQNECVKKLYTFEVPSSTEWNQFDRNNFFVPNVFVDVSQTIDLKVEAMAQYKSELRDYPHPRSLQHIKELAKVNGTKVGIDYSENFCLIRSIKKYL